MIQINSPHVLQVKSACIRLMMGVRSHLWVIAALLIAGSLLPASVSAQSPPPATSSLIVKFVAGLSVSDQAAVVARNGGLETSTVPALRLHVIEVGTEQLAQALASYQADPQVVRAEVNKTRKSDAAPSDPLYGSQWSLPKIAWDQVFGVGTATGTAVVAVLDTGIDATHPDLNGNVLPGTSILDDSNGMTDPSGHGTRVAGIIAARTNSAPDAGIAGVGYTGVRLMPVTVLDAQGLGQDSDVIAGVIWAADHGADVILMAFSNPGFSESLQEAIDYAWSSNVVLVAAVGNDGVNAASFPAGDRGVIGVSATDDNDLLAGFSNYGESVFLAAPGTDILTTELGGGYGLSSGTSSAAAIVAGAAAQLMAFDPSLSNGVVVGRLARSADPAGTQVQTGNGRVNFARAFLDTGTDFVEPAGAAPVGGGGPFVGPYVAAANRALGFNSFAIFAPTGATDGTMNVSQPFTVRMVYTKTGGTWTNVTGTLTVPSGWTKSVNLSVASVTTSPNTFDWTVTPSATPGSGTISVSLTGTPPSGDTCNSCPFANSFSVASVNPTVLSVTSVNACQAGTSPCNNTGDTVVRAGQSVDVKVTVANTGGAQANSVTFTAASLVVNVVSGSPSVSSCGTPAGGATNIAGAANSTYTYTCSVVSGNGVVNFTQPAGSVSATDANSASSVSNGAAATSNNITVDSTGPSLSMSFPVNSAAYSATTWNAGCGPSGVCGTVSDAGSGLSGNVGVSLFRGFNSRYLDCSGGTFNSVAEQFCSAGTSWAFGFAASGFPADGSYSARAQATDNAGNITTTPTATFTIDTQAPTLSIGAPSPAATNTGLVDYLITYTGATSVNLVSGNVTVTPTLTAIATTVTVLNGTTTTRTVRLSGITGNGTLTISIVAGTATDDAGNLAAAAGPSAAVTVDNMPPTLVIGSPSPTATNVGPVQYDIDYTGENAITLGVADVSVSPTGTATGTVTVTGGIGASQRKVKFLPTSGDGTLRITIAAGTATDAAGNSAAGAGPSATFIVDNTLPTSAVASPANGSTSTSVGYNALCSTPGTGDICGTASDPVAGGVASGVQSVAVSIRRNSDNFYWNGSSFVAGGETFNVASGTMSWTYLFAAPPDGTYTVRSRATDNVGNVETPGVGNTFTILNNTAPVVTLSGLNTANEGQLKSYTFTVVDPDVGNTFTLVSQGCGLNGTLSNAAFTPATGAGSFDCTFADGPASSDVTVQVRDSAGADSNTSTITVAIANVAPVVTLSGPTAASEGQLKSYSFTVSDSGVDTFTLVSQGCGLNGTLSNAAFTPATGAGSFDCTFGDGPASSDVTVQVADSDGAASNTSTITVAIANVAPVVTLSGPTAASEGQLKSYSFTVSDSGVDTFTLVSQGCGLNGTLSNAAFTPATGAGSFDCTFPDGPASSDVTVQVADSDGAASNTSTITVAIANVAPTATFNWPVSVDEGNLIPLSLTSPVDVAADLPTLEYAFNCGAGYGAFSGSNSTSCPTTDNGTRNVMAKIKDKDGGVTEYLATVTINNVAPTISSVTGPTDPQPINTVVTVTVNFTDPGTADTHTCVFTWDDGNTSSVAGSGGSCIGTHTYSAAGVYGLSVTVTDDDSGQATYLDSGSLTSSLFTGLIVIYDPSAGFVTGGGWINSPAGAFYPNPTLTGKAIFGFVSKYKKGATVPTGNTEFQFHTADLNFHSDMYDWLVIAGAKAQYKGCGLINGQGTVAGGCSISNGGYGFLLTAIDGQVSGGGGTDKFRMKIWNRFTGQIVYDNQVSANDDATPTTAIGGGSIVVHSK